MAYLDFVKAGGKTYVYLSEYCSENKYTTRKSRTIARLGRIEKAALELKIWMMDEKRIPDGLKKDEHDRIPYWLERVRNRAAF